MTGARATVTVRQAEVWEGRGWLEEPAPVPTRPDERSEALRLAWAEVEAIGVPEADMIPRPPPPPGRAVRILSTRLALLVVALLYALLYAAVVAAVVAAGVWWFLVPVATLGMWTVDVIRQARHPSRP